MFPCTGSIVFRTESYVFVHNITGIVANKLPSETVTDLGGERDVTAQELMPTTKLHVGGSLHFVWNGNAGRLLPPFVHCKRL